MPLKTLCRLLSIVFCISFTVIAKGIATKQVYMPKHGLECTIGCGHCRGINKEGIGRRRRNLILHRNILGPRSFYRI
jgi:hypothetical protein